MITRSSSAKENRDSDVSWKEGKTRRSANQSEENEMEEQWSCARWRKEERYGKPEQVRKTEQERREGK